MKNPSQAYFFFKTIWWQRRASRIRQNWETKGIHVPPIMVYSITNKCNLQCKGCYNQNLRQSSKEELSVDRMKEYQIDTAKLKLIIKRYLVDWFEGASNE